MGILTLALIIFALALALVVEFQKGGRDLLGWAVVLLSAALLLGRIG